MDWEKIVRYWTPITLLGTAVLWILWEWVKFKTIMCKNAVWNQAERLEYFKAMKTETGLEHMVLKGGIHVIEADLESLIEFCREFL